MDLFTKRLSLLTSLRAKPPVYYHQVFLFDDCVCFEIIKNKKIIETKTFSPHQICEIKDYLLSVHFLVLVLHFGNQQLEKFDFPKIKFWDRFFFSQNICESKKNNHQWFWGQWIGKAYWLNSFKYSPFAYQFLEILSQSRIKVLDIHLGYFHYHNFFRLSKGWNFSILKLNSQFWNICIFYQKKPLQSFITQSKDFPLPFFLEKTKALEPFQYVTGGEIHTNTDNFPEISIFKFKFQKFDEMKVFPIRFPIFSFLKSFSKTCVLHVDFVCQRVRKYVVERTLNTFLRGITIMFLILCFFRGYQLFQEGSKINFLSRKVENMKKYSQKEIEEADKFLLFQKYHKPFESKKYLEHLAFLIQGRLIAQQINYDYDRKVIKIFFLLQEKSASLLLPLIQKSFKEKFVETEFKWEMSGDQATVQIVLLR